MIKLGLIQKHMKSIIEYKDLIWIDINEPTEDDVQYLRNNFRLHPLTYKTILPAIHHPDIEIFKNYIFIILHHPDSAREGVETRELDIIASKNYLITSHYKTIPAVSSIFEECQKSEKLKENYMQRGVGHLLFVILKQFLRGKLIKIDEIEKEIDVIQDEIFMGKEKETVKKISLLKRKILAHWRVVDPQRLIFESLKSVGPKMLGEDFKHHFFVISRINHEIEDALRNSKDTTESLERTNHILVTLRLDEVIKILTIFSAIILPLNLLASVWGMNTNLPFAHTPLGFWIIIIIMFITLVATITFFKIRKWL